MSEGLLRIGDVAREAGVSRRTVDFYTRMGLLEPAERTPGNYRLYRPESVQQIHLVQRLEHHGVSLAEIADSLQHPDGNDGRAVLKTLDELDREIHTLKKVVKTLPAAGGLAPSGALSALTDRLRSLVETALEISGGSLPPGI